MRSNYKSQNREKLFMPCRQEVKEKAILDGIQVSTLAGNVPNIFHQFVHFLVTKFLFFYFPRTNTKIPTYFKRVVPSARFPNL